MKKHLIFLLLLVLPMAVFSQSDTAAVKTLINANMPDNTSGAITPLDLREVNFELMRSNANMLERNTFTETQEVTDSILTEEGFFKWSGAAWVEAGFDGASNWSRSGGFILPLDYTDKLRADTALFDGNLYPDGVAVNIGRSTAVFDTVFANVFEGLAGNTLNNAYDQGGAGAGRYIEATDGHVGVRGSDGFAVTGTFGSGETVSSSTGVAMFFNPRTGSFRSGRRTGTEWDSGSLGSYSSALGSNVIASGDMSFAAGINSDATGDASTALGSGNTASGDYSLATGSFSESAGLQSFVFGERDTAHSYLEAVFGRNNVSYTPSGATSWVATDKLFVIGNGASTVAQNDAVVVLKNGNVGIGESTPAATLDVDGTFRYVDGNEGVDHVLTSDADGDAYWSAMPSFGYFDYIDSITKITPISVTGGSGWVNVTNDTNDTYFPQSPPRGVTDVWDPSINEFDWSELSIGDMVDIRMTLELTTLSVNTEVNVELFLGTGGGVYTISFISATNFKSAGTYQLSRYTTVVMGDTNTRDNGGIFKISADKTCDLEVGGWLCKITRP